MKEDNIIRLKRSLNSQDAVLMYDNTASRKSAKHFFANVKIHVSSRIAHARGTT